VKRLVSTVLQQEHARCSPIVYDVRCYGITLRSSPHDRYFDIRFPPGFKSDSDLNRPAERDEPADEAIVSDRAQSSFPEG